MEQNTTVQKGRCINFGNCSKANDHEEIEINLGDDFICPECNEDLMVPPPNVGFSPSIKWIMIIAGILVVLFAIVYFGYTYFADGEQSPNTKTVEPVIETEQKIVEPEQEVVEPWHPKTPDGITIDKTYLEFGNADTSFRLTATVFPYDVPEKHKTIIWRSGDESVAKVDSSGLVTAVADGNVVISAYTRNGLSATCYVIIAPVLIEVASITLDKTVLSLKKGDSTKLKVTVLPENATNKEVIWSSDKPTIARVDSTGLVTAVASGKAIITVTADGGTTNSCTVQVQQSGPTIVQLNNLLNKISKSDDKATDEFRRILGNSLRVEGATNISNVQQLITDVSNGSSYQVTKVNTNEDEKVVSISVSKQ